MKTLYLLRHAKSLRNIPGLTDFERPLSMRGRKDINLMASFLNKEHILPELIISSPACRALTTARLLALQINYPLKAISIKEEIYEAWIEHLESVVKEIPNEVFSCMLLGHNPSLMLFASILDNTTPEKMPTSCILGFELNIDSWNELKPFCGRLIVNEYPNKLKGAD